MSEQERSEQGSEIGRAVGIAQARAIAARVMSSEIPMDLMTLAAAYQFETERVTMLAHVAESVCQLADEILANLPEDAATADRIKRGRGIVDRTRAQVAALIRERG